MLTALDIIKELLNNSKEAYLIGGCVRDKILGTKCTDEDIVTNATGEEIDEIFRGKAQIKHIGKLFGVVQVDGFEVATYRTDIYDDNGNLEVKNINSLKEDCVRRDFTINALAMDIDDNIIDHTNGINDLNNKIIRANGDPYTRFSEDPSRILRAVYLSVKLDFIIEDDTLNVIKKYSILLNKTERNVIGRIMAKVFKNKLFHKFLTKLIEYDLLTLVFKITAVPHINEISETYNEIISYALLFTDIDIERYEIEQILMSYLIPKKDIAIITSLIEHTNDCLNNGLNDDIIKLNKNRTNLDEYVNIMRTYKSLLDPKFDFTEFINKYKDKIYYPHELPLNGNELMELGYKGKELGLIIEELVKNNYKIRADAYRFAQLRATI